MTSTPTSSGTGTDAGAGPASGSPAPAGRPHNAAEALAARSQTPAQRLQHLLHSHPAISPALILLITVIVFGLLNERFLNPNTLSLMVQQTAIVAGLAVGQTLVILTAGIDLSVGAIAVLSMMVMAKTALDQGYPGFLALFLGVLTGAACGAINGFLVTKVRLPPFIVTLGMMSIVRGAALVFTEGRPVSGFDPLFRSLAAGQLGGVPAPVIATLAVYLLAHVVLTRTTFGRYVYAIGGNEEATRLAGVSVRFHKTMIYAVSGLGSAMAAVILTARLNSAQPIAGMMYELDAIAATVIGGTSLMGGEGSLAGTLVGALIMGVLRNGLNLLGVSSFLQQIVIGAVIIAAVLVDTVLKRHRN